VKISLAIVALVTCSVFNPMVASAQDDGAKLLTVSGRITKTNTPDKKGFTFSYADLKSLNQVTVSNTGVYAPPKSQYTGPLLRDILKTAGIAPDAKEVILVGLDGYQFRVPISDFSKWEVVAAHSQNGSRLTVETKGPLWVIYPNDKHPNELNNHTTNVKEVWALVTIKVP